MGKNFAIDCADRFIKTFELLQTAKSYIKEKQKNCCSLQKQLESRQ